MSYILTFLQLYEPYTDNPSTRGFFRTDPELIRRVVPEFLRDGWQVVRCWLLHTVHQSYQLIVIPEHSLYRRPGQRNVFGFDGRCHQRSQCNCFTPAYRARTDPCPYGSCSFWNTWRYVWLHDLGRRLLLFMLVAVIASVQPSHV